MSENMFEKFNNLFGAEGLEGLKKDIETAASSTGVSPPQAVIIAADKATASIFRIVFFIGNSHAYRSATFVSMPAGDMSISPKDGFRPSLGRAQLPGDIT